MITPRLRQHRRLLYASADIPRHSGEAGLAGTAHSSAMTRALEQTRKLGWTLTPRRSARCVAAIVHGVGVCTGSEQAPRHRHVTAQRRDQKCRPAASVSLLSTGSTAQQLIHQLEIPGLGRPDQRRVRRHGGASGRSFIQCLGSRG